MSTAAAPPYTETGITAPTDAKGHANLEVLNLGTKNEIHVGVLSDPSNQALIRSDITKLCEQTEKTRAAFEKISILPLEFDVRDFKDQENKDLPKLRPDWEGLRLRYHQLHQSNRAANVIKVVCDDYKTNIASLVNEDDFAEILPDVRVELEQFVKHTSLCREEVGDVRDSFDALRVEVLVEQHKIKTTFGAAVADPTNHAPSLKKEIEDLQGQTNEAQSYINTCLTGLKAAGAVGGAAAVPVLGILAAGAAMAANGDHIALKKKQDELNGLQTSLTEKKKELAAIEEREKVLGDLGTQLEEDEGSFTQITNQLGALATFWNVAEMELGGIVTHLSSVDPEMTVRMAKSTLGPKLLGTIYEGLGDALGQYIAQMGREEAYSHFRVFSKPPSESRDAKSRGFE